MGFGIPEIAGIIVFIAVYLFATYAQYKLANKFSPHDFWPFLIPFYNLVLLCRIAGKSGWFVLVLFIPYIGAIAVPFVIFGKIAQKLGHNFWLFGFLSLFFYISMYILAFNSSMPTREEERPTWQYVTPPEQDA